MTLPPGSVQVPSIGPDAQAYVGFLSWAPTKPDALKGQPLRGTRGGLFRQIMSHMGLNPELCWLFHVKQIWHENPSQTLGLNEYEIQQTWEEIRWLVREKNLRVLVAFGDEVQKALGISGNVAQNRGSVYELNLDWPGPVVDPNAEPCDVPLIVTHDPEFLVTKRWTVGGKGTADNMVNSLLDFEKALRIASEGYTRYVERFVTHPTQEQFIAWAQDVLARKPLLAVDIETDGFSGSPIVIGFATSAEDAFAVPIKKRGGLNYWSQVQWPTIRNLLDRILSEVPQVYQNALFDVPRLEKFGLKARFRMVKHDTMLLHHVINPEAKHNLGYITSVYGATPFWKEGIFDQGVNILDLDDREVRTYNLRDCVVLHQVLPGLLRDLDELGPQTAAVYYNETLPLMRPVYAMTLNGIKLSESRRKAFSDKLDEMILESEFELKRIFDLPEEFNLSSSDHLGVILYGHVADGFQKANDEYESRLVAGRTDTKLFRDLEAKVKISRLKPLWNFNKSSFKVPTSGKSNKPSTDAGARLALIVACNKRLDQLDQMKSDTTAEQDQITRLIQFLDLYGGFQELQKLKSTYTEFPTWADGRVHGQYLIHGTATGRLASKKPNMQNFPKKSKLGKEVRKLFVAPKGRIFVSADYSNLEARIVGYEAQEPEVQRIFAQGLNQHDINTRNLFHLEPGDPKWDLARRAAKTFQFGLIQYGGSDREIHRKISIEVPELGLTLKDLQIAKENYFRANPNLLQWRLRVAEEVQQTRKITNAFGRIRLFHSNSKDIIKEAYNFPMQSAAASVINGATIRLFDVLATNYSETILVAQIHDQLIFETKDDTEYLKKLLPVIKREMERPRQAWGQMVSFPVDFEIGPSLGELEPFDLN